MSSLVTSIFTFKIESTFEEWAAIFDSAEADKRHSEFVIKPLFRGVSKEDPQKVIVCLLYTSPSPRDREKSRMPSSA